MQRALLFVIASLVLGGLTFTATSYAQETGAKQCASFSTALHTRQNGEWQAMVHKAPLGEIRATELPPGWEPVGGGSTATGAVVVACK